MLLLPKLLLLPQIKSSGRGPPRALDCRDSVSNRPSWCHSGGRVPLQCFSGQGGGR